MIIKRCFKAENNFENALQKFVGEFMFKAHAEESSEEGSEGTKHTKETGDDNSESTTIKNQFNFEQMVAQARKEEKDKLYPKIQELERKNKSLMESTNKYLLESAALKEELNKYKGSDPKSIKELEDTIATLKAEKEALEGKVLEVDTIKAQLVAEYEMKSYLTEEVNKNKDKILTILISDIQGTTKEEIDQSIVQAIEKTKSVKKDLGLNTDDEDANEEEDENKGNSGVSKAKEKTNKIPKVSPSSSNQKTKYTPEYIKNLDVNSEEYKEFRKSLGLK